MNGCELLEKALANGGRVEWTPRPAFLVPKGMSALLQQDIATVKEVMRRALLFREQTHTPGPVPLLVLPGYQGVTGCLSCGERVGHKEFRCPLCRVAAHLALEW